MKITLKNSLKMKAMALNQVQNTQSTVDFSQVVSMLNKAVVSYGKNENLVTFIAVICALVVMVGVVMMSTKVMVVGAIILMLSIAPMMVRWCNEEV